MLPHALCSHIQNSFRARAARVAVPHTTQNLGILSILLRAGFITNLFRGTATDASPAAFLACTSEAQKRIWAELKYRDDRPVLHDMELVSKPSKRVFMDVEEIQRLCAGRGGRSVKPLGMGEIAVVRTKRRENEWLEAREALQMGLGGEIICRVRG